jgi:iron complex transport system substrate-binding protein
MTPRQRVALVFAIATAAPASCSRGHAEPAAAAEARRIVSLAPATTEALFAIDAGDRVVGRSRFCDWPPEAARLPAVGGFVDADLESILQLQPDLVVGAPSPASSRIADELAARGIRTWFPGTDSLASIDGMIVGMGERTGHAGTARTVVALVDSRERSVEQALASEPEVRVLMVLGVAPAVAAGPSSFADDLIRRARGVNVLTGGGPWQTVGFERIVELDPDVVVDASVRDGGGGTRITAQAPGWAHVRAVRERHVVPMADSRVLRPGPRVAEGLAVLARALHPNASLPAGDW